MKSLGSKNAVYLSDKPSQLRRSAPYTSIAFLVSSWVSDRLLESGIGLVQRSWRRVSSGDERQRIGLHFQGHCQSLQRPLKLKHICTKPYTPWTYGKSERFIQTLCKEWAYAMPFQNSQERNAWLPRYLSIDNCLRKPSALSGRSPQQRLLELLYCTTC